MAARGTKSKVQVFEKLMEVYPDSFWEDENKILRIPIDEDGTRVEIKVALTAAKNNLGEGGTAPKSAFNNEVSPNIMPQPEKEADLEPTEEEKANVSRLLASLGL